MELLSSIFTNAMLFTILVKMTPILFAAIGGAFTQQGNILNIGLEGMMLVGAFAAIAIGAPTGPAGWAIWLAWVRARFLGWCSPGAGCCSKLAFSWAGLGVTFLAVVLPCSL